MDLSEYTSFESLVTGDKQVEIECGNYLHHAANLLIPQTTVSTTYQKEERNYFGSSDFIFAAQVISDQNTEETVAYIWELKAPQCYLLEPDDNANRFRPTKDFIKAENQLIHYVHHAQNDDNFRGRFNVLHTRNIRAGGIIIGRSADRIVHGLTNQSDIKKAYESLQIRQTMLYSSQGIRVFTWDRILAYVKPRA
jgi:hypothetical protein